MLNNLNNIICISNAIELKKIYASNTCDGFLASNAELWAYAISPNPVVWVIPNILALPTDLSIRGPLKYFIIYIYK